MIRVSPSLGDNCKSYAIGTQIIGTLAFKAPDRILNQLTMSVVFMLIDDDHEDAELFMEALSDLDDSIVCYTANDGNQAFRVLRDSDPKPSLIFTDINMPIMNGWECLIHLKRDPDLKDIPVIMYSTSTHPQDLKLAQKLKAAAFVSKPGSFMEIKRILGEIVSKVNAGSIRDLGSIPGVITDGFTE